MKITTGNLEDTFVTAQQPKPSSHIQYSIKPCSHSIAELINLTGQASDTNLCHISFPIKSNCKFSVLYGTLLPVNPFGKNITV